jgi:non-homologous end joining protein Ku
VVESNTRAISRVVLYHRERAVLPERRDKGHGPLDAAVRRRGRVFQGVKGKPDAKEKKRLASLIEEHTQGWSPSLATDPVEQALR